MPKIIPVTVDEQLFLDPNDNKSILKVPRNKETGWPLMEVGVFYTTSNEKNDDDYVTSENEFHQRLIQENAVFFDGKIYVDFGKVLEMAKVDNEAKENFSGYFAVDQCKELQNQKSFVTKYENQIITRHCRFHQLSHHSHFQYSCFFHFHA